MIAIIRNRLTLKEFVNFGEVERQLPKLDVAGSIPVSRSIFSISYSLTVFMGQHRVSARENPAKRHFSE